MAQLYSASLAGNGKTAPLILALTAPNAGVSVQVTGSWSAAPNLGIYAQYAFSIDGGLTYSAYSEFLELTPGVPTNSGAAVILVGNGAATNVAIQIVNRDQATALSNVTVNATQFTSPAAITTPSLGATQRSTAGGAAPGQAIKNYVGITTLTSSAQPIALETVTTGKTYLITDIIATTDDAASGSLLISITSAGTSIFYSHINSTKGIEVPGIETQPVSTAGQAVVLNLPAGTVGKKIAWNVFGIEQ